MRHGVLFVEKPLSHQTFLHAECLLRLLALLGE